jgi:hypothetical protein
VIIAGIALAVTVFNGYDGPLIFSEEIKMLARTSLVLCSGRC